MAKRTLRLGTRGSQLARWQADWTADRLRELGQPVEIVEITTSGDANQTPAVGEIGSVGVFTKEIQRALVAGEVDLAVHSLKDLPTAATPRLLVSAVPQREEASDAFVSNVARSLAELPGGARIGTGSLRRQTQLRRLRADIELLDIRGNVDTRLRKLDEGQYDAIVLAAAGLTRLGLADRITRRFELDEMLPAPGQGALGIECRADDTEVIAILGRLNDPQAHACVIAERAMLARVEGGCLAAIGGHATLTDGRIHLRAVVMSQDGSERLFAEGSDDLDDAVGLGNRVGDKLLSQGAARLVEARRG